MYKKLCVFFVLFLITSLLYSDTITLKNGQKYEGKIINQTKERVQIRLENGKELVINKNDIQKIQFGPTPEEIRKKQEEEKRRLEEAKKQEEERKKLEEEKRRLEEAKKQEEERKKLEEEKRRLEEAKKQEERHKLEEEKRKTLLKKESLLKRKELLIYWGVGPSSVHLPLESLNSIFSKKIDQLFKISIVSGINLTASFASTIQGIGTNTSNSLLEVAYNENDWSFGLETIIFELTPLLKNINYVAFTKIDLPQPFLNYEFSNGLKIGKNSSYNFTSFYGKYHFHKWKFFNGTGLLSFPIGIMSHNFDLETEYSVLKMDLLKPSPSIELKSPSAKQNIQSDNTNMLYSGIHLENAINDAFKWKIQLNVYYGRFQYTINVNQFDIANSEYRNLIIIPSGIQRGIGLTNRLEKNIRDNFFVFLDLTYREIRSNVSTIKIDGIIVPFDNKIPRPLSFFSPFGISWLDGKSKRIKEINRNLSFGIIYRFGL